MATQWISPTWRMPDEQNQSKFENYSLNFDGAGEYIDCGNIPALQNASVITWNLWVNFNSANFNIVFGKDLVGTTDVIQFYTWTSGVGYFFLKTASTSVTASISSFIGGLVNTGDWNMFTIVFDGSETGNDRLKIYLNGGASNIITGYSGTVPATLPNTTDEFYIGKGLNGDFDGKIGLFSIFNSTLTSAQITALYNSGTPVNPMALTPLPTAYYPLGGSSTGSASTLTTPNESVPSATVFDFDGSSWITTGISLSDLNISTQFTVSLWVKIAANTLYDNIIAAPTSTNVWDSGFGIYLTGSALVFWVEDWNDANHFATSSTLNNDQWYHVCCTFSTSNGLKLYIDAGTPTTASNTDIDGLTNNLFIGSSGNAATRALNGDISNVQVWNAELGTSDVTTLYNNGVPYTGTQPQTANLKGWWKMNVDTSTWNGTDWVIGDARTSYNKCLNFPNQTDNFKYDSFNFNGKSEISFSFWYNHHVTVNSNDKILGTRDTLYWAFAANQNRSGLGGSVSLTIKTGDNVSSNTAYVTITNVTEADSGWNLLTGTYDGSNFRGYLNGVQVGSDQPITGSLMSSSGAGSRDLNIGLRDGAGAVMAGMKISNFVIWDKGLTSPEVSTLFNGGIPFVQKSDFPQQGNMSLWNTLTDMNTLSGGGVFDNSGNGIVIVNPSNPPVSFDLLVSALNGFSDGMTTANLVNSDLTRSIPYSSYSMDFDAASSEYVSMGNVLTKDGSTAFSISCWIKYTGSGTEMIVSKQDASGYGYLLTTGNLAGVKLTWYPCISSGGSVAVRTSNAYNDGNWHNVLATYDGSGNASGAKIYVDGTLDTNIVTDTFTGTSSSTGPFQISARNGTSFPFDGNVSNAAVFNSSLTEDQILTIYNGGVPNDISSLSPVSWWSLAGDSYFNGNDWICPDLGSGSNNGTSNGMGGTELVGNGPGSTANGIATSMDIPGNLQGNAPNSSKNAFSVNMNPADRVEDVAPTP